MALAYWSSPFVAVLTAQSHRSFAGLSKGLHRDRAHLAQWHLSEYKVEGYLMVLFTLEYSFPHPLKKNKHPLFPAMSQLFEKNVDCWTYTTYITFCPPCLLFEHQK